MDSLRLFCYNTICPYYVEHGHISNKINIKDFDMNGFRVKCLYCEQLMTYIQTYRRREDDSIVLFSRDCMAAEEVDGWLDR